MSGSETQALVRCSEQKFFKRRASARACGVDRLDRLLIACLNVATDF
jgi:hypothetical protein